MSEQPPVRQPDQPPRQPTSQPPNPTQPMSAAESAPPAGPPPAGPTAGPPPAGPAAGQPGAGSAAGPPAPPAGPATSPTWGNAPKPNAWQRATSTNGGRWGLAIASVGLAFLLIAGVGIAGILILRNHDRVNLLGQRQDSFSRGQDDNGRGFGNRQGPGADRDRNGQRFQPGMPGMPGVRAPGIGGLRNLMGGAALHGEVSATLNGSVQQLVFQRGEVTAVSDTSIALKSSDGFVGTYGRNGASITRGAAPVKGGQAFVLARASDKVAITIIATRASVGPSPTS